ncbi:hypothetical protein BJV78DRAFT_955233 [Lactifluus subvellereus]|nr:hypothetical protein BJV78DRAFT_955233 [Lactifluus subvellereus]
MYRTAPIRTAPSRFSSGSATFTSIYIKAPMLPLQRLTLPPPMTTPFYVTHRRIVCATSQTIAPAWATTQQENESSSGEVPETSTRPIPVTTSSGPASRTTNIPSEASQDIAADSTTEVIADIPSPANPILQFQFTPARGAALQPNEETLTTTVSPAIVPGSLSSTPFLPAPSSALAGGLYLPTGPSVNGSGRIPHGPVSSSSSSTTAFPRVTPQVGPNIPTLPELSRNLASDHPVTEET